MIKRKIFNAWLDSLRIGFILALLVIGGIYLFYFYHQKIEHSQKFIVPAQREELIVPAIIDAANDIIHIPTLQSGIVKTINVTVGEKVKKGQILFTIEDIAFKRNLKINQISVKQAENSLRNHKRHLAYLKRRLALYKQLDKRTISQLEYEDKKQELQQNLIQLEQLIYNLKIAKNHLKNAELSLAQHVTRAPKDGVVLQVNAHVDEFVGGAQQIIFLGDADKVIARVSIDERDLRKFHPKSTAYLTHVDYEQLTIPLTFLETNKFIIVQERLNSRVQEVLYFFDRNKYSDFVAGQQFDAHIIVERT